MEIIAIAEINARNPFDSNYMLERMIKARFGVLLNIKNSIITSAPINLNLEHYEIDSKMLWYTN